MALLVSGGTARLSRRVPVLRLSEAFVTVLVWTQAWAFVDGAHVPLEDWQLRSASGSRLSTGGSAMTLPMTDEEKAAAAEREKTKTPIGFS